MTADDGDSVVTVRVCTATWISISSEAALLYIPEAVPRLVFVDRRRGGRVSASAAPWAACALKTARGARHTDILSAKTGSLSAADGCDVAARRDRTSDKEITS